MRTRRRLTSVLFCALAAAVASAAQAPATSARTWIGHEPEMEAHLRTAQVTRLEDIGTGVTLPRRAYVTPSAPFDSFVWKLIPPGRHGGYWDSYKSESRWLPA